MDPATTAMATPGAIATPAVPHSGTVAELLRGFTLLGSEWVLWLLIFLSILSVTVIIERVIYFYRNRTPIERFLQAFTERLSRDDVTGAAALADMTKGAEARLAKVALTHFAQGDQVVEEMIASRRVGERMRFERYLMILGTMGNNAQFIGLFGTVLGIIRAFHDLAMTGGGAGGATAVMAGIAEALVATAVGLLVAIPAVIAYNYFMKKVKEFSANAETIEAIILAHIKATHGGERKLRPVQQA
jgi:biopolymer transport protein ExbB